eukprot:s2224_g2.t1
MVCGPGKRVVLALLLPALRAAGLGIVLELLPINIGSGAACSRALLHPYNEPKDNYQFTYIHPLRNFDINFTYITNWSLTTSCSLTATWTLTSPRTLRTMPTSPDGPTTTSSTTGMELMKDTYIPVFTNKPQDYREWRQRINLYRRKLELQNKPKEAVDTILAKEEGGFDLILAELDTTFRYNEDVEMPRAFERFFYGLSRKPDQTLLSYVADHREALTEVEKHGVQISDKVSGWILLRRSGLSSEQKQLIQSQCPKLSYDKVVENMYFLLGQDYKGRNVDSQTTRWKTKTYGRWSNKNYGYLVDEPYDLEEPYDEDYAYQQWEEPYEDYEADEGDELYDEDAYGAYDYEDTEFPDETYGKDGALEEAYTSYLDARRHFAQMKAARGYFLVVALADSGSSMAAGPQSPISPKGKSKGKGKVKGKPSYRQVNPPRRGSASSRANATRCLRCGQIGHWAANCTASPSKATSKTSPTTSTTSSPTKKAKTETAMMVRDLAKSSSIGIPLLSHEGFYGIQDGGASFVVCGHEVLMRIIDHMKLRGVLVDRFLFAATNKVFGFGGDANRQAHWSVRLPVYIDGKAGYIETFIVEGNTPLLIGRPILQALNIKIDYNLNKISIQDGEWQDADMGQKGEYLLCLDNGVADDLLGQNISFDYVTSETCAAITNYDDLDDYISIHEYLMMTNRSPPETALLEDDKTDDATSIIEENYDPVVDEDPSAMRRPITTKIIKTLHMEFNSFNKKRRDTVEQVLHAYQSGRRIFWEVYSGSANLSTAMKAHGWDTVSFDYNTGWDFDIARHRREFLELQDQVCPDFVWYSPKCTEWSPLQNLNTLTEERKMALQAERDYHEKVHLKMCRRSYLKQRREGRHGALEQPRYALSWKTRTLHDLPGYQCHLDQCQFEVTLPDENGDEQYIKKPTRLQYTDEGMANELGLLCPGGHFHLPLEGSSPGLGNRAQTAGVYQGIFCNMLSQSIVNIFAKEEPPQIHHIHDEIYAGGDVDDEIELDFENLSDALPESPQDPPEPHQEVRRRRGILSKLQDEDRQAAKRTITRLHRNLGHPSNKELVRLLKSKNVSQTLLQAAQEHECGLCDLHKRPTGVPVSSMPKETSFNERVQTDTLWINVPGFKHKQPVLMMSDAMNRLLAARFLKAETTEELIKQIESAWISFFGPMKTLQVDEHRAWSSDAMREWATEQGIRLVISPGQSHTRLAILERRHQVTRRAISLFLESNPGLASDKDGLIIALNYIVPQLNRTPNVHGFSPLQWVLGYSPSVPGLLSEESSLCNPAHLDPSERFMETLRLRQEASKVMIEVDTDSRLRRALLRKYMGQPLVLQPGDLCFYWRDTPAGSSMKLKWRGPATVIAREPGAHGPHTDVYWIAHGTDVTERARDPLDTAKQALANIRQRGVTQFIDLQKSNKRRREEIATDEEEEDTDQMMGHFPGEQLPPDRWEVAEDGRMWTRIHSNPRRKLYVPEPTNDVPVHLFLPERATDIRRGHPNPEHIKIRDEWRLPNADRELHYVWTGTTTFFINTENLSDNEYSPGTPLPEDEHHSDEDEPSEEREHAEEPGQDSQGPPTSTASSSEPTGGRSRTLGLQPLPEDAELPAIPPSMTSPMSQEEEEPMEEPTVPGETFAQQRARTERQESLLFKPAYGPHPKPIEQRPTPYSGKPLSNDDVINATLDIDIMKECGLPAGWILEKGMLALDEIKDDWTIEGNYLTRKHYLPRNKDFKPTEDTCPLPLKYLMKDRYSKKGSQLVRDKWSRPSTNRKLCDEWWTGYTRFKICPAWRKEAKKVFMEKSEGKETMSYNETKIDSNAPLSERTMSLADRLSFLEAKKKELESFFQNKVWFFDDAENAPAERVLKARFILTWKKHENGTPRAKARLVVQGFRDPDAHLGNLSTASPTLTRFSRNYIMTTATMLGMTLFTSDISTAFLQGKNFDPNSKRIIWVKLPRDGEELLGLPPGHGKLMKLVKPMYGLCDAPRAWYEEATTRILKLGDGMIIQHPLDACLFLAFDRKVHPPPAEGSEEPRLIALFGIHVDDIFGCYYEDDEYVKNLLDNLKKIFSFREWVTSQDKDELEYCGAQITKVSENHWKLNNERYLAKQKPITYSKERHGTDLEVTDRERTSLRGLVGGLQWPATQTSPHIQCMVSTLAGQISKAKTSTLDAANRMLRFAKQNSDAGLEYRFIGNKDEITLAAYSDASFASRGDLISQGGYFIVMLHRDVTTGGEGHYNIIDWRSWKLTRVARSTLAAESQAASEAADALLFASTFWKLIWSPWLPLDDIKTAQLPNPPKLVVDAKALFDILVKEEIHAGSNTDKRIAIEVLVTQDKLLCCNATTMWVSSELQYSDGLTKGLAAQLLADRLRSHLTRLKSDTDFVASKKKSARERKKGAEKYAIKKPSSTTTTAMFAAFCTTAAKAFQSEIVENYMPEYETNITYHLDTNDSEYEPYTTIMAIVIGFLVMMGAISTCRCLTTWPQRLRAALRVFWKAINLQEADTPETAENGTQTDDDPLIDDLNELQEKILRLEAMLEDTTYHLNETNDAYAALQTILQDHQSEHRQRIIQAGQQEIYFTAEGRIWHANYHCLRQRTSGPIYHRTWCSHCLDQLGLHPQNQAPTGSTQSRIR